SDCMSDAERLEKPSTNSTRNGRAAVVSFIPLGGCCCGMGPFIENYVLYIFENLCILHIYLLVDPHEGKRRASAPRISPYPLARTRLCRAHCKLRTTPSRGRAAVTA